MPLAFVLDERDPVPAVFVPHTNQNGIATTTTGDQNILFIVDRDTILGEDGNSVVVSQAADTDERDKEIVKRVSSCGSWGQPGQREGSDMLGSAAPTICNAHTLG